VSTIVFFHAHPDDESSQTAGSMSRASDEGHRVVVVYATGGEHGEVPDDLAPGESVADRRRAEAEASARVTGTARIAWLGYRDSGMTGWEQNSDPGSFHQAPVDEAAARLARVLDEEDADVLVGYDWHGSYGHPDHVKVHAVTYAAAGRAARTPRVLEETMNRDVMRAQAVAAREAGLDLEFDPDGPMDDGNPMGLPEAELHWAVDVSDYLDRIRAAMQSHRSQVSDIGMFMAMPSEVFEKAFGTEYFVERGRPDGMVHGWFLEPGSPALSQAEDLPIGQEIACGTHEVTQDEIIGYASAWDPQYFHVDPARAADSEFGQLIASGLHTLSIYQKLAVEAVYNTYDVIAGRSLREVKFLRPVRAGDVLSCSLIVADVTPDRPGRSAVTIRGQLRNQLGKPVLEVEVDCLIRSRGGA